VEENTDVSLNNNMLMLAPKELLKNYVVHTNRQAVFVCCDKTYLLENANSSSIRLESTPGLSTEH